MDDAYAKYVADMEAEGETPLSREEWENADAEEIPSYEEYLKIVKDLGDDSVEVVEKDVWDDFSDDDKIELVKTLKLSKIGGNEPINPDKEVEIKVGKEQTYADVASKAAAKPEFFVRRIMVVNEFRNRNAFINKINAGGSRYSIKQFAYGEVDDPTLVKGFAAARAMDEKNSTKEDTQSQHETRKDAEAALRDLMVADIRDKGLKPEKIFEYTPEELTEVDPYALGFRFTGVVGRGERKTENRGGVTRGQAGRAGVKGKSAEGAYEDSSAFEDVVEFMKSVYEAVGDNNVNDERARNNILDAARRPDFWYSDGFDRIRTVQYYIYYSKGAYEAKGMSKEDLDDIIDDLTKEDTMNRVQDETKSVDESCGKPN